MEERPLSPEQRARNTTHLATDPSYKRLQVLNQFARDLIQLSTSRDLIWYVVEEVVGQLGFVDCVIYLYDPDRKMLIQTAAFGEKKGVENTVQDAVQIPLGQGITGSVAQSLSPEIIADTTLDDRYVEDLRQMRSEITVPIVQDGTLFGVIDCENPTPGFFKQDHLDYLTTIASMLAGRLAQWHILEELNRHKQDLEESEEKYRHLFERSEDAMILWTEDRFLLVNAAAARIFRYASPEEMQQIHPLEASPEYQPCGTKSAEKASAMMRIVYTKGYNRFEWVHRKKTGECFPVEVSLTKVPYQGKTAVSAICRDITVAKHDREALMLALDEAEHASKAKSSFLANMSHELRTPLNAILGMSEVMKERVFGPLGSEKYLGYANDIHSSGQFLLNLINDILDLSAIDADELIVQKEKIILSDVFSDCIAMVKTQAISKNITIQSRIESGLAHLLADPRGVRQILLNLMTNAIKFSGDGSEITVEAQRSKKGTLLIVSDNGAGIPKDRLATITRRFDRGVIEATRAIEGTGLGLAIVESIVTLHGGKLSIESEVEKGTTITIAFPKQ